MRNAESIRFSLARWKSARRVVLSAIILAGSVATSAAVMYRMSGLDASAYHRIARVYTYSGIGVVIEDDDGEVVVRRVIADSPAQGKLRPGMRLVSVEGERPDTLEGWAAAIRGEPGTDVDVEVASRCRGHKTVTFTRQVIRIQY